MVSEGRGRFVVGSVILDEGMSSNIFLSTSVVVTTSWHKAGIVSSGLELCLINKLPLPLSGHGHGSGHQCRTTSCAGHQCLCWSKPKEP